MSLILAWLAFPLLVALLGLGCGLLVERASGVTVAGALIVPLGLALIVVITRIATHWDATAELATPVVVVFAAAGLVLSRARLRLRSVDYWAVALPAAVLTVFGAPVFCSGEATFAGYTLLGDTSIHFVLIDHVMEHGRDVAGLESSSYRAALEGYFGSAYPLGSHTALGAIRPLVGQDVAWVFQPYLACLAALTSLALYGILLPVVRQRGVRAAVAFVSAQPALVFAYSLQGTIKEMATIFIIALCVAVVPITMNVDAGVRRLVPLAVATAAAFAILNLAVAPWLGPILLACFAGVLAKRGFERRRATIEEAGTFAFVAGVLAFPTLLSSGTFAQATRAVVTAPNEFGNLLRPLRTLQMFGIWPSGDYRLSPDPGSLEITYVLIGIAGAAALLGLAWAIRTRALGPLLYIGVSLIGWAYATSRGSPWVDAKALAIVSPAVVLMAALGPVALLAAGRRVWALPLAALVSFGVAWSNALAYHDVDLAPRDRLEELARVANRIEDRRPSLYTEFEEFAKHFLRDAAPTGWAEAWHSRPETGKFGFAADIDELPLGYVLDYRSLVLRRSPSLSRPPAVFTRTFTGRYYEVWQRPERPRRRVLAHLPLGDRMQAAAKPDCTSVRSLARQVGDAKLAYVARPRSAYLSPASLALPASWRLDGVDPFSVRPAGPGRLEGSVYVRSPGRQDVWIQGSFGRATEVRVDGRRVGEVSYELSGRGQYAYLGKVVLAEGRHALTLVHARGDLHPGNGGGNRLIGPVVLSPQASEGRRIEYADAGAERRLCRRVLDWVELVRD